MHPDSSHIPAGFGSPCSAKLRAPHSCHGVARRHLPCKAWGRFRGSIRKEASPGCSTAPSARCNASAPNSDKLMQVLAGVRDGRLSPDAAAAALEQMASGITQVSDFAALDTWRAERTGAPEAVWGPGKTPQQICAIMDTLSRRERVVMATRIAPPVWESMRAIDPRLRYEPLARIALLESPFPEQCRQQERVPGTLAIVSAGTADTAVAEECRVVAEVLGCNVLRVADVGVAGLHRLLARVEEIRKADVVVVVAGMDGALPSVVAGLVESPVIACPTSIGYGAALGGLAPMLSSLNSCAPGLTVVNVDNGFGAAMAGARMLRVGSRLRGE